MAGPAIRLYVAMTNGDKKFSAPPNKRIIIKNVPYRSIWSQNLSASPRKKAKTILDPSNGGIGIKLKKAKSTLTKIIILKRMYTLYKIGSAAIGKKAAISLDIRPNTMATKKFEAGPAKAINAPSLFGSFRLYGLKGTGFAQPNINGLFVAIKSNGTRNEPKNSKCFIGFKVSRPISLAVLSPSLYAISPCETS